MKTPDAAERFSILEGVDSGSIDVAADG